MVILDEICLAVARRLIDESRGGGSARPTPAELCLVLTGREASPGLIAAGRHGHRNAFDQTRPCKAACAAQKGVER